MMIYQISLALFLTLISSNALLASQSKDPFTAEQYAKSRSEIDLDKKVMRLRVKRSITEGLNQKSEVKESPKLSLGFGSLLNWLAYITIALLLIFILYTIFSNIQTDNKTQVVIEEYDETEELETIHADQGYLDAVNSGNFRLAIRMQFIKILQHLSSSKKIIWQADKTNRDYAKELKSSSYYKDFTVLSSIYEWVWYGKNEINSESFTQLNARFTSYIAQQV